MSSRRERRQESDSVVEKLRLARTNLTQDQFCSQTGIPRATYHRWIRGVTEPKLTPSQFKAIAKLLGINSVEEFPSDFKQQNVFEETEALNPNTDRSPDVSDRPGRKTDF